MGFSPDLNDPRVQRWVESIAVSRDMWTETGRTWREYPEFPSVMSVVNVASALFPVPANDPVSDDKAVISVSGGDTDQIIQRVNERAAQMLQKIAEEKEVESKME